MMAAAQIQGPNIDALPDNIFLEILGYLSVKELCIAGGVSRKWRRIVNDNSLWRHVDLSPDLISLQHMWRIFRAHISPVLLSLKIRGFWGEPLGKNMRVKPFLSSALMKELQKRCPSINKLCLYHCDTKNFEAINLPSSLETLIIQHSVWEPKWLNEVLSNQGLPHLVHLDVSACERFDACDLEQIAISGLELQVLKLNGCYRIKERGFFSLSRHMQSLTTLEVSDVGLTPLACQHIGRNLSLLKHLRLAWNGDLDDDDLDAITSRTAQLEVLDIFCCDGLTNAGLLSLVKLKNLKTLIVCSVINEFDNLKTLIKMQPSLKVHCK